MSSISGEHQILKNPPTGRFIVASILVAFSLNVLPWQGAWLLAHPDFLLLTLLYWVMHRPRTVGMLSAFCAGIVMDVDSSALLGQHALVYVLLSYLTLKFRLRVLEFPPWQQALHVAVILLLGQLVMVLLGLLAKGVFPGYAYFIAAFAGAAVWPVLTRLIELPHWQPVKPNTPS